MITIALNITFCAVGLSLLLTLWRLGRGPSTSDRILALDTLSINAVALMGLLSIRYATAVFFEIALLIALMGFISTIAFCKYLQHGNIIE